MSLICFFLQFHKNGNSQQANFSSPDTVCVGQTFSILNLSTNISNNYWNFCSGNLGLLPSGVNLGNISGQLTIPTYSQVIVEGDDHFLFMMSANSTPSGNGKLIRYFYGNSFMNPVQSYTLMPNSLMHYNAECFRVYHESDGNYYGFMTNGLNNTLLRYEFGNSLWNTPIVTNLGNLGGMNFPHGLEIVKDNGSWVGLVSNAFGDNLSLINWGSSLANIPVGVNLGNIGSMNGPRALAVQQDEVGDWYVFINNNLNNSLTRVYFGNSFSNSPVGVNLGQLAGVSGPEGLTMLKDCDKYFGFIANYAVGSNSITQISFPNGLGGPVTSVNIGNIGSLDRPGHFSNIFRDDDAIYMFLSNRPGHVSRLKFDNCPASNFPSSVLFNPPPISYSAVGTYTIVLVVDEGLFSQETVCKEIVVLDYQPFSLGSDQTICYGDSLVLQPPGNLTNCLWSTGSTSSSIVVKNQGYYWLETNASTPCSFRDSIYVTIDSIVKPDLGIDIQLCSGDTVSLSVQAGYPIVQWSTGESEDMIEVTQTGSYWVTVGYLSGCSDGDTINVLFSPSFNISNDIMVCHGDSSLIFGVWQTQSGQFINSLTTVDGCDSIENINFIVADLPIVDLGDIIELCEGDSVSIGLSNPEFNYQWSNGSTQASQWISSAGKYVLTVTDINGCTISDSLLVYLNESFYQKIDTSVCFGEYFSFGGFNFDLSGVYSLNYETQAGCDSIFVISLNVFKVSEFDLGEDYFICEGDEILLHIFDSVQQLFWQDGSTNSQFLVTEPGVYWVSGYIGSCLFSDTIRFSPCSEIWFPNSFTPNGDNLNDVFGPKGNLIQDYTLSVFNRWGELIFESYDFNEAWDGTYNGTPCQQALYVYVARFRGVGPIYGGKKQKSGFVNLMR